MNEPHSREAVVRLQTAHAAHIRTIYEQTMRLPGNTEHIEILNIGGTPVFLSGRNRLENRAIFTGNETIDILREITGAFERRGVTGFFEKNPANFYRSNPFSWKSEMLPALLELGFSPDAFRCVWHLGEVPYVDIEGTQPELRRFSHREALEYVEDSLIFEPVGPEIRDQEAALRRHLFTEEWSLFIGYENGQPVSHLKLFVRDGAGFLAWGYTLPEHRRKRHHRQHVLARVRHALTSGCTTIF